MDTVLITPTPMRLSQNCVMDIVPMQVAYATKKANIIAVNILSGAARIRRRTDMKRYTEKIDGLWTVLCEYGDLPCPVVTQDVIDLLAAYEDTGLSPEEIIELKGRMEGLEK